MKRWSTHGHLVALLVLFVVIAALRIALAYQSPLPDYEAYGQLRHVRSIQETGTPLYHDDLSFGGRTRVFSPLYQYLLALFGLLVPELWLVKVLPNLFAAAIAFPAYGIGKHLTQKRSLGLVTAGMAGLVPAAFLSGINDASPLMLTVTLMATAAYLFMRSRNNGKRLEWLLVTIVALVVLQPISVIFLLGLALYVVLLQLLRIKTTGKDIELLLFTLFFSAWFAMVVYKQAFVAHGAGVIWRNIPAAELSSVFAKITSLEAVAGIGLVTLLLGAYALYDGIMNAQRKPLLLLSGLVLATIMLVWFRLVPLRAGLAVLGVLLAIAASHSLALIISFMNKTKASRYAGWAVAGIVALFLLVGLPTIISPRLLQAPAQADIQVLEWADEHLADDAVILASPVEGDLIAAVARRATVLDDDYLLVPRAEERFDDARRVYTSYFKTDALSLMQKYGATHLYVSVRTREFSGVLLPEYLDDDCFDLVRERRDDEGFKVWLYERTCSVRGGDDA